MSGVICKIRQ